jgi:hypothetical protein
MIKDIAEEDQALEPMNHDNAESDMMSSSRSRPSQRTIGWMPGEGTFLKTLIKIGKFQAMPQRPRRRISNSPAGTSFLQQSARLGRQRSRRRGGEGARLERPRDGWSKRTSSMTIMTEEGQAEAITLKRTMIISLWSVVFLPSKLWG